MIVNPSVSKPKEAAAASTRGSHAKQQRRYTIAETPHSLGEGGDEGGSSTCHRPSTRMSRRRSSIRSTSDKVEDIYMRGEVKSSKDHCPPTYVRVSRRRSSIHIAPENTEEIRREEEKGDSSRVSRRRSSILIAPEKAEEIRICVEGNSSLGRERLEEKRARLDQKQQLLVAKRKSLIERWENETLNNLQVEVDQNETKGLQRVRGIWSKIGEMGGELLADSRQALSGLKNVVPNRVNARIA